MNRIIDDPDDVVEDALVGIRAAHPDLLVGTDHPRVMRAAGSGNAGRVGIVTGGGSGHEPAFVG
ncbi:MAG: dihydroxyacetone kinase subunit DhaK, partial [Janthinobacterium lividum]